MWQIAHTYHPPRWMLAGKGYPGNNGPSDDCRRRGAHPIRICVDPWFRPRHRRYATANDLLALEGIARHRPDIVLLDIRMPHIDGLALLRGILQDEDPPTVAILTTFGIDEYVLEALRLGASGFLLKDTDPRKFAPLVKTLALGGIVLSPNAAESVVRGLATNGTDTIANQAVYKLSDRERSVLIYAACGFSNREIASHINCGIGTVKDDMSAVLAKLGVKTRVEAALIAQRAGILSPGIR